MKKILFLLLLSVAMYGQVPADATPLENIQITNNQTSTTATKVNVQETDGTINTISKSDLVNVVEVNDVPSLPLVGDVGKIYVVKNLNKIYRWNGIFYQELAVTDISGKVDKVAGKGLSTEDYTTAEKTKLSGIQAEATANSTDAQLRDRATHTGVQPANSITEDADHRFTTDAEKATWNSKQNNLGYTAESISNKVTDISTGANNTTYPTSLAVKSYADNLVVGMLNDRGTWDASVNVFPTTGGSGTDGAIRKGDMWYVSIAGTLGGKSVEVGDSFRALVNSPAQVASNWSVLEANIGYVPANDANVVHITGGETITGQKKFFGNIVMNSSVLLDQSTSASATPGYTSMYGISDGFGIYEGTSNKTINIKTTNVVGTRTFQFPNADGTIALTSNLSSYQPLLSGTGFVKSTAGVISYDTTTYTPSTGGTGYIQNQNDSAQSANMWISGKLKSDAVGESFASTNSINAPKSLRLSNTGADIYFGVDDSMGSFFGKGNYSANIYAPTSNLAITSNNINLNASGDLTASSFIKSSAPTTNLLLAGGGDIAQSTFPLANGTGATGTWGINISGNSGSSTLWGGLATAFTTPQYSSVLHLLGVDTGGTTAWRYEPLAIQNWLGLGTNAYSSTPYLPLSGGTLTGVTIWNNSAIKFQTASENISLFSTTDQITGSGSTTDFNAYVYGNNSYGIWTNGAKRVTVGGDGNTTFQGSVTSTGFFNQSSDRRLKYIHKRDGDVAYFTWKDGRDDKMHIGYIAQEVRKQFPDQVQKNEDGYLSVSYIEILVAKNRELEKRLEALENRINQLEKSTRYGLE